MAVLVAGERSHLSIRVGKLLDHALKVTLRVLSDASISEVLDELFSREHIRVRIGVVQAENVVDESLLSSAHLLHDLKRHENG